MKYSTHDCKSSSTEICRKGTFHQIISKIILIGNLCRLLFSNFFLLIAYTTCGGNYANASGILTSPSYPNPYPRLADCIYLISQPIGTYVNISFINMDVSCHVAGPDYIEMRDGNSKDSPLMMGRFCGNGSNIGSSMQTTQNHLRIR